MHNNIIMKVMQKTINKIRFIVLLLISIVMILLLICPLFTFENEFWDWYGDKPGNVDELGNGNDVRLLELPANIWLGNGDGARLELPVNIWLGNGDGDGGWLVLYGLYGGTDVDTGDGARLELPLIIWLGNGDGGWLVLYGLYGGTDVGTGDTYTILADKNNMSLIYK